MTTNSYFLDNQMLGELLICLLERPTMHSWLDEQAADELTERGLFDLGAMRVSPLGRDWLAANPEAHCGGAPAFTSNYR